MLNYFEPCTLQIGDRNHYTLKESDIIMMKDEWKKLEKESFLGISSDIEPSKSKAKRMRKAAKVQSQDPDDSDDENEVSSYLCEDMLRLKLGESEVKSYLC